MESRNQKPLNTGFITAKQKEGSGINLGIVLASKSPRRFELLKMTDIGEFKVIADTADEVIVPGLAPDEQVCGISLQKAQNVARLCNKDDIIIAADTIVYYNGRPYGKPDSREDAERMQGELSGNVHSVYTGVTVLKNDVHISGSEKTDVWFRGMTDGEIRKYVLTGEPMDKAGSYAAQGGAAIFIERIEGDFFNVVGLPLCRLSIILKEFGVAL